MFRRRKPPPKEAPAPQKTQGTPPNALPDTSKVVGELLSRPTTEGVLENALAYAATLLGGSISGFAVLVRGQDRIAAVYSYPRPLVGMNLSGPWTSGRPRILNNGSDELFENNSPEVQAQLEGAGLKDVTLSMVAPITDRGRTVGALVLDRYTDEAITPIQLENISRWATSIGPLLGILDAKDGWLQAARQITQAVVEAVESQEFDSLGHAGAVADISLKIGKELGLAERELEELWFAATLHDLGKIHGEEGHASVGANFLHDVPYLSEAQKAIRHHHERWDGNGEPDKLAGEDIPLYARILAVANVYVRTGGLERVKAQADKGLDPRMVNQLEKALK